MSQRAKLAALYALAVLSGARGIYYWKPSILDVLIPIAVYEILTMWARADARRRGEPIPLTAAAWVFMTAPITVSGYLIWTRGWRGLGWVAANWVGVTVVATAVMHAGGYAIFGRDWLAALGQPG